jgi:hypothetical protein
LYNICFGRDYCTDWWEIHIGIPFQRSGAPVDKSRQKVSARSGKQATTIGRQPANKCRFKATFPGQDKGKWLVESNAQHANSLVSLSYTQKRHLHSVKRVTNLDDPVRLRLDGQSKPCQLFCAAAAAAKRRPRHQQRRSGSNNSKAASAKWRGKEQQQGVAVVAAAKRRGWRRRQQQQQQRTLKWRRWKQQRRRGGGAVKETAAAAKRRGSSEEGAAAAAAAAAAFAAAAAAAAKRRQ